MLARYHRRTMDTGITQQIREPMAYLRGHLAGLIRFDENVMPIKFVIGPEGRMVAPVMVAMLTAGDTVLHLPDEEDDSMHVMVTLESFEEKGPDGALADRWRIYHGEPEDVRWAIMHIDAARLEGVFYDGDALLVPNVLNRCEASVCRWANDSMVDGLKKACMEQRKIELNDPKLVGVDPLGFDVRGRFDVVRLDAPELIHGEEEARAMLEAVISG